jgi:hypothetical protein
VGAVTVGAGAGCGGSLVEMRSREWRRGRDESGDGKPVGLVLAPAACLYTTPSSSRKYAGPIFLFSALHCAKTRSRRRFAVLFQLLGGSGSAVAVVVAVASGGSRKSKSGTYRGGGEVMDATRRDWRLLFERRTRTNEL